MLLISLSPPLTLAPLARIEELAGEQVTRVIQQTPQFDHARPFAQQARELVEALRLSAEEWQTLSLLVNLPGLASAAAALLAELHGRMGHFPAIVRLRSGAGSTPTQYEVAEIINLQALRESARIRDQGMWLEQQAKPNSAQRLCISCGEPIQRSQSYHWAGKGFRHDKCL